MQTVLCLNSSTMLIPIGFRHFCDSLRCFKKCSAAFTLHAALYGAAQRCSNRLRCNQRQHSHRKQRRAALRSIADKIRETDVVEFCFAEARAGAF